MECQIERGCGLDVHRDTVAACVRVPGRGRAREQHVRTFGTTAAELLQLRAWLAVAHAMLVTAYHLLARQITYQDPGSHDNDRRQAERARRRAIQTLERQGFRVALEPAA
jgi:hypothetical protein